MCQWHTKDEMERDYDKRYEFNNRNSRYPYWRAVSYIVFACQFLFYNMFYEIIQLASTHCLVFPRPLESVLLAGKPVTCRTPSKQTNETKNKSNFISIGRDVIGFCIFMASQTLLHLYLECQ